MNNTSEVKQVSRLRLSLYDLFYASKKKKTYTNLGIALVLLIVFLIFALLPTVNTLDTVQEKIRTYENLNESVNKKINTARKLIIQMNRTSEESPIGLKEEIDLASKIVLNRKDLDLIYENIYQRTKKHNVKLISLAPKYNDKENDNIEDSIANPPTKEFVEVNISAVAFDMRTAIEFVSSLEGYTNFPIPSRLRTLGIIDSEAASKISNQRDDKSSSSNVPSGSSVKKEFQIKASLVVYIR